MKKKGIVILFACFVGLLCFTGCNNENEEKNSTQEIAGSEGMKARTDFLDELVNVSYIEKSYDMKTTKLNTKLAKLLNNLDSSSIFTSSGKASFTSSGNAVSDNATGEQPYSFVFYDKNDKELYRLQYYSSDDEMIIYIIDDARPNYIKMYYIKDDDVLKYIKKKCR